MKYYFTILTTCLCSFLIGADNVVLTSSKQTSEPVAIAPTNEPDDYMKLLETFLKTSEEEMETKIFRCKNVSAETVRRLLENFISPAGIVARSDEDDLVVVTDVASRMKQIEHIVSEADRAVPQVLVEVRIVEFEITDEFERDVRLGFADVGLPQSANPILMDMLPSGSVLMDKEQMDFNGGGANSGTGQIWSLVGNDKTKFWMAMKYLQTKKYGRLLSSPNLIIRRGANGSINTGVKVPIAVINGTGDNAQTSTRYENVGVKLTVQPVMISGTQIRLKITPEASNVGQTDVTTGSPYITTRSMTTEMELTSGELVILGGLLQNENRVTETAVPYLSKIPILGWFFRGESTRSTSTQLVIFVTPYIIDPSNRAIRDSTQRGFIPDSFKKDLDDVESNLHAELNDLWPEMKTDDENVITTTSINE